MRLSTQQRHLIKSVLMHFFGSESLILLFGSRVDDTALGGDIDIYIEPEISDVDQIVEARLDALVEMHKTLGEQKIDLVIRRKSGPSLPIHKIAKESGVLL